MAQQAKASGYAQTILYRKVDSADAVRDQTGGQGMDVAYDSVGAGTFHGSLDALKTTGHLVNFGQSSGPVKPLEMSQLAAKSFTVSRTILFHYLSDRAAYHKNGFGNFRRIQGRISVSPEHSGNPARPGTPAT